MRAPSSSLSGARTSWRDGSSCSSRRIYSAACRNRCSRGLKSSLWSASMEAPAAPRHWPSIARWHGLTPSSRGVRSSWTSSVGMGSGARLDTFALCWTTRRSSDSSYAIPVEGSIRSRTHPWGTRTHLARRHARLRGAIGPLGVGRRVLGSLAFRRGQGRHARRRRWGRLLRLPHPCRSMLRLERIPEEVKASATRRLPCSVTGMSGPWT